MAFTHNRATAAGALGISETRLQQHVDAGVIERKGAKFDITKAALALLAYLRRDEEGRAARTRQFNARALQVEQRVRREMRRHLTLDEVRDVCVALFEGAIELVQAESSRFYSEYSATHDRLDSLAMTHRLYDPLRRIAVGWSNGVAALIERINTDALPDDARLAAVLKQIIAEIAAANAADEATVQINKDRSNAKE
jgi:hypothetical protein